MANTITFPGELSVKQQEIQDRSFHSAGPGCETQIEEFEQSIPDRFETIVGKYPDRIAVKTQNHTLTYSELNARANRVARALLQQPETETNPVALLFEKDAPLIAAMLAVLKAGRFFVLLDPSLPKRRLAAMLEESQADLVFTDQQNISLALQLKAGRHELLEFASIDHTIPAENLSLPIPAEALAFIVFTSGSTGQPKGVIQNHRNILFDLARFTRANIFSEDDRFGHLSSGTSNAVKTSFITLLSGATLLLFDVRKQGVSQLSGWLLRERISVCFISSPLFRSLCETLTGNEKFPDFRLIRLTSETVYKSDVDLYKKFLPSSCRLFNGLSSSETGILRCYLMNHQTCISDSEVPVGYPVEGKDILLLNDLGKEVGINEIGEIIVRSDYLSPGYWRRPDLTEAKFKPDPQGGGKRLYHTGDLGLMLADGCLIHKGRKDFRVKIRGYGVDILEVETILREHNAIQETVVVAGKNDFGEGRLVAYFISNAKSPPSVTDLRSFLLTKLPDYMVPSIFVRLDAMPLTPNGKVNRSALPNPDTSRPDLDVSFVAPRTPTEEKLVQIWENIFDFRPIGIHDDFFELGGHSLLATRLFVQIDKVFRKQLPLATLFYARTIEQLAGFLRQDGWTAPRSLLVPIQPNGSEPPLFWASGGPSDVLLAKYLGQDQPLHVLNHQCHDGKRARYARLEDLAAKYLEEIRTVQQEGPYFLGGSCFQGMVTFEMAQQLRQQGQEVALLVLLDLTTIKNCKFVAKQVSTSHESLPDEALRHLSMLAKLNSQEKLKYVLVRVNDRIHELVTTVANQVVRSICKIYLLTGRPVPLSLRLTYISSVDRKILHVYEPQPYPGRLIHLKAERSYSDTELVARLSCGQLETDEVSGGHSDLGNEPHVAVWARKLKAYLQQAQAKELRKQPKTFSASV